MRRGTGEESPASANRRLEIVNRAVRRNPRPLGRGQGARMQITKSTLEVGEAPPFKAGFFNCKLEVEKPTAETGEVASCPA